LVNAGYRVTLVAPNDSSETVDDVNVVHISNDKRRLQRILVNSNQVFHKALQLKADLYHFHDPELIPAGLLLTFCGRSVVYDIHEDVPLALFAPSRNYMPLSIKPYASWIIRHFENIAAKRFAALIAATPAIGLRFKSINKNTYIINNFPMTKELISPDPGPWNQRLNNVCYVGAISQERGLNEMIAAMGFLPNHLDAKLKLAGPFSPSRLRDVALRMPEWRHVDELGFINRVQLSSLLGQVRAGLVLFHPDPNHIQSQPNKLFEYMSAGIPVIASDFPVWRKLVSETGCGLVVDPLDSKAIADAIEYLLTHPLEAETMGERGRETVKRFYNWEVEEKKLLTAYKNILSNRP